MKKPEWVDSLIQDVCNKKAFRRVIQYGIDHLEGKKLYKYYSFNSEYTLNNIRNGTIYLQNPVLFNDPFDCNIGISVNQLISAMFPDFFDKVIPDTNENVREVLSAWLLGIDAPDLDEVSREKLFAVCVDSAYFVKLMEKSKQGYDVTEAEVFQIILEDSSAVIEIIRTYLELVSGGEEVSFDNEVMQNIIRSPQTIRNLILSFGPKRPEKEVQIIELLASKDDFFGKIRSIADIVGIDVPQGKIEETYNILNEQIKRIRESIGGKIGVECFTQSPADVLMWSYYADKHTGICVEFDFSILFSSIPDGLLLPVYYSEDRPLLDFSKLYDPISKQAKPEGITEEMPNLIWSWITKSIEWEREKEWRLISTKIGSDIDRIVKLPIMSRIITGINVSEANYQKILEIATEKGIPVHRARLKNDKYLIEII